MKDEANRVPKSLHSYIFLLCDTMRPNVISGDVVLTYHVIRMRLATPASKIVVL